MKLLVLAILLILIFSFPVCQNKSSDKALQKQSNQDSLKTDPTTTILEENKYPPEPEGYKGIHQEEKEKYDQAKK